jgi:hypothetical protein
MCMLMKYNKLAEKQTPIHHSARVQLKDEVRQVF